MSLATAPRYGRAAGARGYADHRRDAATPPTARSRRRAVTVRGRQHRSDGYTDAHATAPAGTRGRRAGIEQVSANLTDDSGPRTMRGDGTRVQATAQVPAGRPPAAAGARAPRWAVATLVCGAVLACGGGTAVAGALSSTATEQHQQDNLLVAPDSTREELTVSTSSARTDGRQEDGRRRSDTIIVLRAEHPTWYLSPSSDTGQRARLLGDEDHRGLLPRQPGGGTGGARLVASRCTTTD